MSQRVSEQPTDPFTLRVGTTAYVMVAVRAPTDNGLSGGLGGAATLRVIPADRRPNVTTDNEGHRVSDDPKVNIREAHRWDRLKLAPGDYRFYSLAGAPTIVVIACPG